MMGKISIEMQESINPKNLRQRYGDEIGNEVWFLIRVVKKDDEVIKILLNVLDEIMPIQQKELIKTVWQHYYQTIANKIFSNSAN